MKSSVSFETSVMEDFGHARQGTIEFERDWDSDKVFMQLPLRCDWAVLKVSDLIKMVRILCDEVA